MCSSLLHAWGARAQWPRHLAATYSRRAAPSEVRVSGEKEMRRPLDFLLGEALGSVFWAQLRPALWALHPGHLSLPVRFFCHS